MNKLINFSVISSLLVANLAFAHVEERTEAVENISTQVDINTATEFGGSENMDVQPAGTKSDYEKTQTGSADLRVQSGDITGDKTEKQTITVTNEGRDRLRIEPNLKVIWDSGADVGSLELRAKDVAEKDENIRSVEVRQDSVKVVYRRPAKLFGFIPVAYYHAFTLDGKGQLAHGRPWWLIFARSDVQDFEKNVKAAFQNNQSNLDFLKLQDAVQKQSRALEVLSNVLKTSHDTAMSVIRNLK